MIRYWCPLLWTGTPGTGSLLRDVLITVQPADGRIAAVTPEVPVPPPDAVRLAGFTMPGLANAHSHAFHRALRGRTHRGRGSFWTWREQMYAVAGRLDPDSYLELARAGYAEMALAGITVVGEFHYLHHAPDGRRYGDPNAMGAALVRAAAEAGIRITLLDTCYLTGGLGVDGRPVPLAGPQLRFGDGDAESWLARAEAFRPQGTHVRTGSAIHSVRAVPADQLSTVAKGRPGPLHLHLSEQRAENDACRAAYGRTPSQLLAEAGALRAGTTAVHATHLTGVDLGLLRELETRVCLCPTTERDLADGIGPAAGLSEGRPGAWCLGSDSHAVVDLFEEARAVELDERLRTETRGHFTAAALLGAATGAGQDALGWPDAGRIEPGALADLVTLDTTGVRLAGCADWTGRTGADPDPILAAVVFAATAADVRQVIVAGRFTVRDGVHQTVPDAARRLDRSVRELLT